MANFYYLQPKTQDQICKIIITVALSFMHVHQFVFSSLGVCFFQIIVRDCMKKFMKPVLTAMGGGRGQGATFTSFVHNLKTSPKERIFMVEQFINFNFLT